MLRRIDGFVAATLLAALIAGAVFLGRPDVMSGAARVIDGDTIELAGRRVRLSGLDAPELDQTCGETGRVYRCGETARDALRSLIGSGEVLCAVSGRDQYGRDLARCDVAGRDLGAILVLRGLAVASGRYAAEEREAKTSRIGLWAGPFELPSRWRSAGRA